MKTIQTIDLWTEQHQNHYECLLKIYTRKWLVSTRLVYECCYYKN